jgi:hypothetical protein
LTGATARAINSSGVGREGEEAAGTAGEESGGGGPVAVSAMVGAWRRRTEEGYCISRAARAFMERPFSTEIHGMAVY